MSEFPVGADQAGAGNAIATAVFRPYRPEDSVACLALFEANCPEYFAANERQAYERFLEQHADVYEVCIESNKVVAAFGLRAVANDVVALNWIMIEPASQGAGIGTQMMQRCVDKARIAGASRISIAASHRSAAFFGRFGAESVKQSRDGWGPGMHRVDMRIQLE